jgi:DNA-binding NarL/FixJ family response regulator
LEQQLMKIDCGSILVVDDDDSFRELISIALARAGYSAAEAANGDAALDVVARERPAAVLLDVQLDGMSGYAICRELREKFGEQLPIIFLSGARMEASDRVAGLLIGADDYMTKPLDPDELVARVRRALTRAEAAEHSKSGPAEGAVSRLTKRERDVLTLLAEGLGTDAIAARLYISPKTVGTHVQRVLAKLDMHSRAEAVAFAYREGLIEDFSERELEGSSV